MEYFYLVVNAVCTGLEPVTSCVAPNERIELP